MISVAAPAFGWPSLEVQTKMRSELALKKMSESRAAKLQKQKEETARKNDIYNIFILYV